MITFTFCARHLIPVICHAFYSVSLPVGGDFILFLTILNGDTPASAPEGLKLFQGSIFIMSE